MKPLRDFLTLQMDAPPEKTEGGVVMPDTNDEKPNKGVVVAIGPAVKDIKEGDRVLVTSYAGVDHKDGDTMYLLVREEHILAIV